MALPPPVTHTLQSEDMSSQGNTDDEWEARSKLRDYCVKGAFYQAIQWGSVFGVAGSAAVLTANKYSPAFRRCVACVYRQ